MIETSVDLREVLAQVRELCVALGQQQWAALAMMVDSTLPDPLDPMALLPIATGTAAGGKSGDLVHMAAAVLLFDVSLRIVDDCADMDDPDALVQSIGIGRAVNYAMALNAIATRELVSAQRHSQRLDELLDRYFRSFLLVCEGQDRDMGQRVSTLAEYQAIVELKTVAAYEFAAVVGARIASAEPDVIASCSRCGVHLGWMTQILDDIEALWFPIAEYDREIEKMTFPVLLGLTIDHPNSQLLSNLYRAQEYDRTRICTLLDEMNVRSGLMNLALDHRDSALEALAGCPNPEGHGILKLWLDWLLRDAARLLGTANQRR